MLMNRDSLCGSRHGDREWTTQEAARGDVADCEWSTTIAVGFFLTRSDLRIRRQPHHCYSEQNTCIFT